MLTKNILVLLGLSMFNFVINGVILCLFLNADSVGAHLININI